MKKNTDQLIAAFEIALDDIENPLHYYWEEVGQGATQIKEGFIIVLN